MKNNYITSLSNILIAADFFMFMLKVNTRNH